MKRLLLLLAVLAVACSPEPNRVGAGGITYPPNVSASSILTSLVAKPIKIALVGDSMTVGDNGSTGARVFLWQKLRAHGSNFVFTGTQVTGDAPRTVLGDWHHDGHSGFEIEQFNVATWFASAGVPDVVCILGGANNFIAGGQSSTQALGHMATLLATTRTAAPNAKILVFNPPPILSPVSGAAAADAQRVAYTAGLGAVASANGATYWPIGWTTSHMSLDGIHPNYPRGYSFMADNYAAAIMSVVSIGGPVVPRPLTPRPADSSIELVNAATDDIVIPYGVGLMPPGAGSFTAAINYRPSALPAAAKHVIMQYGVAQADGFLVAQIGDGVTVYLKGAQILLATGLLSVEHWYRIVVAFDATLLECRLYVTADDLDANPLHGHLANITAGLSPWNITVNEQTTIGFTAADKGAVGIFDHYEFAAGTAATITDVEADYRDGKGLPGETANYAFSESSGATLADYGRFANPSATLAGTAPAAGLMRRPLGGTTEGLAPKQYTNAVSTLETNPIQTLSDAGSLTLWLKAPNGLLKNQKTALRWADLSGVNGAFMAQGGLQPTLNPTGMNGQPALQFDGIGQFLGNASGTGPVQPASVASTTAFTLWAVVQVAKIATNSATLHSNDSILADSGTRLELILQNANPPSASIVGYDGSYHASTSTGIPLGKPVLLTARLDTGKLYINVNGGADPSGTSCGTLSLVAGGFYLGKSDGSQFMNGQIAQIVAANTVIAGATRTLINTELMAEYGITADTSGVPVFYDSGTYTLNGVTQVDVAGNFPINARLTESLLTAGNTPCLTAPYHSAANTAGHFFVKAQTTSCNDVMQWTATQ